MGGWWGQAVWTRGAARQLWALLSVQFRQTYTPVPDRTGVWKLNLVLGGAGMAWVSWITSRTLYDRLVATGHAELWLPLVLLGLSLVSLAAALSGLGSAFFHLRDLPLLAALPVPPGILAAAKLLVALVGEWIALIPLAPALLPGALAQHAGPGFWLRAVPVLLVLPLPCLAVAAVVILLIARLVAGHRQQDAVVVAASLAGVLTLSILVPFFLLGPVPGFVPGPPVPQGPQGPDPATQAYWDAVASRVERILTHGLPHLLWAAGFMLPGSAAQAAGSFAGLVAVALGAAAVACLVAAAVLPRTLAGALTMPWTAGATRRGPWPAAGRGPWRALPGARRSPFRALVARELSTWRSPQEGLAVLFIAVFYTWLFGRLLGGPSLQDLAGPAPPPAPVTPGVAWNVLSTTALSTALALSVVVPRAAVSAEGRRFWLSLAIPVEPWLQLAAKLAVQTAMALVVAGPTAVVRGLNAGLAPPAWACLAVTVSGTLALLNAASLLLDAGQPDLRGAREEQAPRRFGIVLLLVWGGWMLGLVLVTLALQATGSGPLTLAGLGACVVAGVGLALWVLRNEAGRSYRRIVPPA
ncbi:hypothetical protein Tmar_1927 [Thermaerobacter marianensis DSM 12885]|uniref:ABC-2 type transport system permease protein n=1 Tax=Thermaerobacter marianensis (strain ATCC 700841 / DSM 12885 / JCM 10246 / 7p75a) TaxID=644966 RepID=E6SIR8_THEM7|nr:hypothetical protein [Thermaerobacter marianensis]ADU52012.1 hypothetical protein Tmar_1927 [Thermaerobacter marianensis DSM 12885]